jgi:hypothetical protein
LEDWNAKVDINSLQETVLMDIKISAKISKSRGSTKDAQNYLIKGNTPNCSGYRIQAK